MFTHRPPIEELDTFHERIHKDGDVYVYGIDSQGRSWNIARDVVHEYLGEWKQSNQPLPMLNTMPTWKPNVLGPKPNWVPAQQSPLVLGSKPDWVPGTLGPMPNMTPAEQALQVQANQRPNPNALSRNNQTSRWEQIKKSTNNASWTILGAMATGISKTVVYGKEKLASKNQRFHNYNQNPDIDKRRVGAVTIALLGVAAFSLASKYGLDFDMPLGGNNSSDKPQAGGNSMFDNLITDIQQNAQDALDNIPDTGLSTPDQPSAPEAPTIPDPPDIPEPGNEQVFPTGRNISSGQSYWTESIDYARDLGYDLDQQDRKDLLTIDAIKDEVLRLNRANGDPNSLPIGTEVRMPPADKVHDLYKKYH